MRNARLRRDSEQNIAKWPLDILLSRAPAMTRLKQLIRMATFLAIVSASLAVLLSVSGFDHSALAQDFLAGFEDVPVMNGLHVIDGAGIEFDAPSGRIAEAYAAGKLPREAVLAFYKVTLQQLGWHEIDTASFEREGETLRLGFDESSDELTVHFRLAPIGTDGGSTKPAQSN
jgi:hypothetical protein